MKRYVGIFVTWCLAVGLGSGGVVSYAATPTQDWATQPGFSVYVDTSDYRYPTSIAFVPDGPNVADRPNAPLYYVGELHGRVKVVSRDRTVRVYADNLLNFKPGPDGTEADGGIGLVGLCVDPASREVFATLVGKDDEGIFRNRVIRFRSEDGGRTVVATDNVLVMSGADEMWGNAHQIQSCRFGPDGKLYVNVGNGDQPNLGHRLTSLQGKVLRLNPDGTPPLDNPHFGPHHQTGPQSYIYASGFRNPFDLVWHESHLILNENGVAVDRLLKIEPGAQFGYDGTDESLKMNATWLWGPGPVAPVGMDVIKGAGFPASKWGRIYVGLMGPAEEWTQPGRVAVGREIQEIILDSAGRIVKPPQVFAKYTGKQAVSVVPVATGPDGLYFGEFPLRAPGETARILKITYEPTMTRSAENTLSGVSGSDVYESRGCAACHRLDGSGGTKGPDLTYVADNLKTRLQSADYLEQVRQMLPAATGQRQEMLQGVLDKSGDERIPYWLKVHFLDPRFDNPKSAMPAFHLDRVELDALVKFLMKRKQPSWVKVQTTKWIWWLQRHKIIAALVFGMVTFCLGLMAGAVGMKMRS